MKMTNRIDDIGNDVALKMSVRLKEIAEMLRGPEKLKVADVGCDHGYVSIYLVTHGIAKYCIAMDVRSGPLSGARENISGYGLSDDITTRLSDGLKELGSEEADALVIAGMGGNLMRRIIEDGRPKELGIKIAILQPQSDIMEFRQFLRDSGYIIVDEKVIEEDGKFYFPIKVAVKKDTSISSGAEHSELFDKASELLKKADKNIGEEQLLRICNRYGECNILKGGDTLKRYLMHGQKICSSILKSLDKNDHAERISELSCELSDIKTTLMAISLV